MRLKQFNGDVAIARNLAAGGDASIEGGLRVGHDVRIDGVLQARGMRGCDRGLYLTPEALSAEWPEPEAGWWALVGSTLPARLYVAINGAWADTGREAGAFNVDVTAPDCGCGGVLEGIADRLAALEQRGRGQVAFFSGSIGKGTVLPASTPMTSASPGYYVSWAPALGQFVLVNGSAPMPVGGAQECYANWGDRERYMDDKMQPYRDCLYIDTADNRVCRWDGESLIALSGA